MPSVTVPHTFELDIPFRVIYSRRYWFSEDVEHQLSIIAFPEHGKLKPAAKAQLRHLYGRTRGELMQIIAINWLHSERSLPLPDRCWYQLFGQDLPTHRIHLSSHRHLKPKRWRKPVVEARSIIVVFVNFAAINDAKFDGWIRFIGTFLLLQAERTQIDSAAGAEWLLLSLYSAYRSLLIRRGAF